MVLANDVVTAGHLQDEVIY